jgi:hypothetical protein
MVAPDVPEFLTPSWIREVTGWPVTSFSAQRIGDGMVGMNLRLTLEPAGSPGVPATVVVKLPSPDPVSRQTGIELRNYEREVGFYQHLAMTVDIRAPRCFHASWDAATGDFVLVLEDLAPAAIGNQISGCTPAQARDAVVELAGLHAPRWGDPSLDDIEFLSRRVDDDVAKLEFIYQMTFPGFSAVYGRYLTTEQLALAERLGSSLRAWLELRTEPQCLTHGDYRLDNLFFATAEGGPTVAAVDWQTIGQGAGAADLSYFLGAGLPVEDRRTHERELVAVYVTEMERRGVSLAADETWEHYRRDTFAGVVMTVVASQIVGHTERGEQMFAAMATRHLQHALDLDAAALLV